MTRRDFCIVCFYEFKLGRKAVETVQNIQKVWGEKAIGRRTVQRFFRDFRVGNGIPEVSSIRSRELFDEEYRELTAMKSRIIETEAARDKAECAKVEAQQKAQDACRQIMEITAAMRELENKQRKFDEMLAEEKSITAKAMSDRDLAQQQARDAETRHLNAVKELQDLQAQVDTMEKERRLSRLEVDDLATAKEDDAGKNIFELEKAKKRLEDELAKAREQIVQLEHALQLADDAKRRTEVMHQAAKQEWEEQMSQRNEEKEHQRRSLTERLRELVEELNAEQSFKLQAAVSKKRLEAQISTLQQENEHLARKNEEVNKQIRRVQLDLQNGGAEARAAVEEALCKARDSEKRLCAAEEDISRLRAELSLCQLARRKADAEREDLAEELAALRQGGHIGQKELPKIISDLKDMLEDERTTNELMNEKLKKTQAQVEQLSAELTMRRSMCERANADKVTLERTLRDLESKLQEAESTAVTAEARAQTLEQRLQAEGQEKARVFSQARRLEEGVMEMNKRFEEERRQIEERANARYKAERRRAHELREVVVAAHSRCREMSRELMDMKDENDSLLREVNTLRARVAIAGDHRLLSAPRDLRRSGSNNSITEGDDCVATGTSSVNSVGGSDDTGTRPSSRNTLAGSNNDASEDVDSVNT